MSNPLLHIEGLPPFSQIKPEHIQPAIQELIEENRQAIEQVLKQPHFTWENFIEPLSEAGERLSRAWSPISHLNSVKNSPELRDAYQACLPLLSEYSTWVGQHKGLYNAYLALKNSPEFATYSVAQKKAIETAGRTLAKLQEMDEDLAASLVPEFKSEPKFDSLFKLSIKSDDDISINKRGSGVRRLILLNFFRAEAERKLSEVERNKSIIYAFEEPETSQHPSHQKLLIEAFLELSSKENTQIILTTHTPALGGLLPTTSLRLVEKSDKSQVSNGSDEVLQKITETLGVLPDPISNETKGLILIEGKTDIIFFEHLCKVLKESGEIDKTFKEAKIALVPTGGCDNLKSWITMKTVDQFGLPFGIFLDSDRMFPTDQTKNTATIDKNTEHGRIAFCTRKREAENYLHPDIFGGSVCITDYNDVKEEVKKFNQTKESKVLKNYWPKMTIEQIHEQEKYRDNNGTEHFELTEIVKSFLTLVG